MVGKRETSPVYVCLLLVYWSLNLPASAKYHHHSTWKPENKRFQEETDTWSSTYTSDTNRWSTTRSLGGSSRTMYGSQEGVQLPRKKYGPTNPPLTRSGYIISQELEDIRLANEHFLKMRASGRCKIPRERVIRVKDYYPDPSKEYLPRCTLLHRCGEESGCCDNDAFECVAHSVQEVSLSFYTIHLGRHSKNVGLSNAVEKLLFINHTECECQPINDVPRIQESPHVSNKEQDHPVGYTRCRDCPVPYAKRNYTDGRCACDCFDRHKPCLKVKRGREALTEVERRCIETHHCHIPECEYGEFDINTGRCPRKPDDFHRPSNKRLAPNHRWTHIERD